MDTLLNRITSATVAALCTLSSAAATFGDVDPTYVGATLPPFSTCDDALAAVGDSTIYAGLRGERFGMVKLRKDGTLDTAWGDAGKVLMPAGTPGGVALLPEGFLPTPDGGVIAVGQRLARFTRTGSLDTTYGTAGLSDLVEPGGFIEGFALQADGSAVVLARGFNGADSAAFTRIGANGRRDPTFGSGGVVAVNTAGIGIYAWSVLDNGLVEYGTYPVYSAAPMPLRLSLAPASGIFNPGGRIMPRPGIASWVSPNLNVQPDGGVLFAAAACNLPDGLCTDPRVSVSRYRAEGSLDTSFGEAGQSKLLPFPPGAPFRISALPRLLSVGQGGMITVLVHASQNSGGFFPAVNIRRDVSFRLLPGGALDPAFENGKEIGGGERYLQIDDGRLVAATRGTCTQRLTSDLVRMNVKMAEYYQSILGHYFITAEGLETGILDADQGVNRWRRTGSTFGGWLAFDLPGAKRVCRFHGDATAGPNSHFYTLEGSECDFLKGLDAATPQGQAAWRFEGHAFSATEPSSGLCPTNLVGVYRAYNRGFEQGGVPNHRYTTEARVYEAMIAQGWAGEGVKFCVPPASSAVSSLVP